MLSLNTELLESMSQKFGVWLLSLYFAFGLLGFVFGGVGSSVFGVVGFCFFVSFFCFKKRTTKGHCSNKLKFVSTEQFEQLTPCFPPFALYIPVIHTVF